jgi:indole-3-glycerol phosphate synthase
VIRKDFTVDARDICDARIMGADCVLLIAAVLTPSELASFLDICREVDIDALVEVHDEAELEVALHAGATLVGVNQRDLVTFAVDQARAVRMAPLIPDSVVKVAESGVRGRADAVALRAAGYDAILVGEHLVTSANPEAALTELCVE